MSALMLLCKSFDRIYTTKLLCLLFIFLLTAKMSIANEYKDNIDEYKAPNGGWKIIHQWNVEHKTYENYTIKAVSSTGKETLIRKWLNLVSVTWLNSHVAEIVDTCGVPCKNMCFFDTERGVSESFLNVIAYSIKDNLIAYPSYNDKKERAEIVISEIYTEKKEPVAVIYRKWEESSYMPYTTKAILDKDMIHLEYGEDGWIKKNIYFRKDPPFVAYEEKDGTVKYYSTRDYENKTGYIWFAAENPPAVDINLPNEAPLCYKFPAANLTEQLEKLKNKYGTAVHDEKIVKHADSGSSLFLKRKDEFGNEIEYFYFDNPRLCTEYQINRLEGNQLIPFYDYDGCVDGCCKGSVWPVIKKTVLHKSYSNSSPIIGTANVGQQVEVLNGVTITKQLGVIKISEDKELNDGTYIKKGDVVYALYWTDPGCVKVWHNKKMKEIDLTVTEQDNAELISEIWMKFETADGDIGWTNELKNFEHDYCHNH